MITIPDQEPEIPLEEIKKAIAHLAETQGNGVAEIAHFLCTPYLAAAAGAALAAKLKG